MSFGLITRRSISSNLTPATISQSRYNGLRGSTPEPFLFFPSFTSNWRPMASRTPRTLAAQLGGYAIAVLSLGRSYEELGCTAHVFWIVRREQPRCRPLYD